MLLGAIRMPFFHFMQLPLSTKIKFEFPYNLIDGKKKLLSVEVEVVHFSAEKHLYFPNKFFLVLSSLFKV